MTPGWAVGVEFGALWATTEEIVEALPARAAQYVSRLIWEAPAGVTGIHLGYRTQGALRVNVGVWYLAGAGGGTLVNLDYLDATSDAVTHRSVSRSDLGGVGWELSADVLLTELRRGDVFVRSYARAAHRGAYHTWAARGGEYAYPDRQGRFADDDELVRYLVLHRLFDIGAFVELGQERDGLYGRLGGSVSVLALVDDRDTHVLSDTEYYNTYRRGWRVRSELAVGVGFADGSAVEIFYEPTRQFSFEDAGTKIKTPSGVYAPQEKPNYEMTLHRVGIRLLRR